MKITLIFLLFLLTQFFLSDTKVGAEYQYKSKFKYELPEINDEDEIIEHNAYILKYNEQYEQADWVAYMLTTNRLIKKAKRMNTFRSDPLVEKQSAQLSDYAGSGYDRGHLAPAADMAWSDLTMNESFYMSNMSPQTPSFNRGIWKKLEDKIRQFTTKFDTLYIATGPVLEFGLPTIGRNKVAVPNYYYKVICVYKSSIKIGIGFLLPNKPSKQPLEYYVVTIDSVENITKLNFFSRVPEKEQNKIESHYNLFQWFN